MGRGAGGPRAKISEWEESEGADLRRPCFQSRTALAVQRGAMRGLHPTLPLRPSHAVAPALYSLAMPISLITRAYLAS